MKPKKRKAPTKAARPVAPGEQANAQHRRTFDQLLGDAILGVPKKKKAD